MKGCNECKIAGIRKESNMGNCITSSKQEANWMQVDLQGQKKVRWVYREVQGKADN